MKLAYFVNHRNRLTYNDGSYVQLGDSVEYDGKKGKVFTFDWLTISVNYDNGLSETNVPVEYVKKIANRSEIENAVTDIIKNSYWIK